MIPISIFAINEKLENVSQQSVPEILRRTYQVKEMSCQPQLAPHPRIAPRSYSQYKVGPPFCETSQVKQVFRNDGTPLIPILHARTDRGIELQEGEWVGFKRNYFSFITTFEFKNELNDHFHLDSYFLIHKSKQEKITQFEIEVTAEKVLIDVKKKVHLFQFTAKRDSNTKTEVSSVPVIPAALPSHAEVLQSVNTPSWKPPLFVKEIFKDDYNFSSALETYENNIIQRMVKLDRVQFGQSCSARERFKIIVSLIAKCDGGKRFCICSTESPELRIFGRANHVNADITGANINSQEQQPITTLEENNPGSSNAARKYIPLNKTEMTCTKRSHSSSKNRKSTKFKKSLKIKASKSNKVTILPEANKANFVSSNYMSEHLVPTFPYVNQLSSAVSTVDFDPTTTSVVAIPPFLPPFKSFFGTEKFTFNLPSLKLLTDSMNPGLIDIPTRLYPFSKESLIDEPRGTHGITSPINYSLNEKINIPYLGRHIDSSNSDFSFESLLKIKASWNNRATSNRRTFTRPSEMISNLPVPKIFGLSPPTL